MSNPLEIPLQRLQLTIERIKPQLIDAIGVEGLKFIDDNFAAQGFRGPSFQPWAPLKYPNKPRPHQIQILTSTYRRSWVKNDDEEGTMLSSDFIAARALNEGVRGPVYVRSRMGTFGKPFIRNMNLPARPVIGPSPVLNQACERIIIKKLITALPS